MIQIQLELTLAMLIMGVLLVAGYDILIIGREIIRRSVVLIALEDFLYWIIGAICTFKVIYNINEGVPRGYAILALLCSAVFFQWLIGRRVVSCAIKAVSACRKCLINLFYRCKIKKNIKNS